MVRRIFESTSDVPAGVYFSLSEFDFHDIRSDEGRLPQRRDGEKFIKLPRLAIPVLLPLLATAFMMFIPALALVGVSLHLIRKFKGRSLLIAITFFLALPLSLYGAEKTKSPKGDPDEVCVECHATNKTRFRFLNGETAAMAIDVKAYKEKDVHSEILACTECHESYTKAKHPQIRKFASLKDYRMDRYGLCKHCHEEQYRSHSDSIHNALIQKGDLRPPVCTDCHSVHVMTSPKESRRQVVETCGNCHERVFFTYKTSVHGRALTEFNNKDVPTCIDCHAAHDVQTPLTKEAHLDMPEKCARCHANAELMGKYGLRADVYETYLEDFHGVSVQMYRRTGDAKTSVRIEATCTDCHGYHDIRSMEAQNGAISKASVTQMCERCHADLPEGFSAAWLSHYRPSPLRYPLVFGAHAFYWFFIPFTILGLAIHLVLHHRRHAGHHSKEDSDHVEE